MVHTTVLVNFLGILFVLALLGLTVAIKIYLLRRATYQVILIMRRKNSRCSEKAKTVEELGLTPPNFYTRLQKPKDYKPYALQALINVDAIRVFENGRICLAEENLAEDV